MDLHPFKPIILFMIVPTLLFAAFAFAGFGIAILSQTLFRFDFDGAERLGFDMPFSCMSLAWMISSVNRLTIATNDSNKFRQSTGNSRTSYPFVT